jgi:hypothetical protein
LQDIWCTFPVVIYYDSKCLTLWTVFCLLGFMCVTHSELTISTFRFQITFVLLLFLTLYSMYWPIKWPIVNSQLTKTLINNALCLQSCNKSYQLSYILIEPIGIISQASTKRDLMKVKTVYLMDNWCRLSMTVQELFNMSEVFILRSFN